MSRGQLVEPDPTDHRPYIAICESLVQSQRPRARTVKALDIREPHVEPLPDRQCGRQQVYPAIVCCTERAELLEHLTLALAVYGLAAAVPVHHAQVERPDPEPIACASENCALAPGTPTLRRHQAASPLSEATNASRSAALIRRDPSIRTD